MSVTIVKIPADFPPGWDLADEVPPGADRHALLNEAAPIQTGLRRHIMSAADFAKSVIKPRPFVVDPFLSVSSLSMIYAARGIGKTWFGLSLSIAICYVAQFVSFSPDGARTRQEFSRIVGHSPNDPFLSERLALETLLIRSPELSINLRSFSPDDPRSREFVYGITNVEDAVAALNRLSGDGLFVIANETVAALRVR